MTEFKHPPQHHQSPKYAKSQQSRHFVQHSSGLRLWSGRSLLLGLSCITGLGLLSNRVIGADEFSVPMEAEPVESSVPYLDMAEPLEIEPAIAPEPEPAWIPEPEYIEPEPITENYVEPEPVLEEPFAEPEYIPEENYYAEPIEPEIPSVVPPPEQEIVLPEVNSPANAYIDPTDYQIGATDTYESPSTVVFSERSTGCEASVALGQAPDSLCAPSYEAPIYQAGVEAIPYNPNNIIPNNIIPNNIIPADPSQNVLMSPNYPVIPNGVVANSNPETVYNPSEGYAWQPEAVESSGYYETYSSDVPITGYSPVVVGPIAVSSMSNSGLTYYNRTQRPASVAGNGDARLIFPLSLPAPITSLFGWRSHPVLGYGRFHTGIDIGADEGTPVVASYSGQVSIADWLGGYGLTVVLDHQKKSQESLYAHLSELFVKPGEFVNQGDVIGRVGSTGLSTGPHLHFELRKLTSQGWVAIDPRNDIEVGLAQLLNTMKVAEVPTQAFIAQLSEQTKDHETGLPKLPPLPPGVDVMIPNLEPPTLNFGFVENIKTAQTPG